MRIAETNAVAIDRLQHMRRAAGHAPAQKPQPQQPDRVQSAQTRQVDSSPASKGNAKGKAHGVVQKLMDGHFRGVAAMRLRINFHDQLAAAASGETKLDRDAAEQSLNEIFSIVEDAFGQIEAADLTEEQAAKVSEVRERLTQLIEDARVELVSGGSVSADAFSEAVRTGLDELSAVLAPVSETSADADDVADADAADELDAAATGDENHEAVDLAEVLQDLRAGLLDAVDRLTAMTAPASLMPPMPTAPQNSGAAFQKFVNLYEQMYGNRETEAAEAVDVSA